MSQNVLPGKEDITVPEPDVTGQTQAAFNRLVCEAEIRLMPRGAHEVRHHKRSNTFTSPVCAFIHTPVIPTGFMGLGKVTKVGLHKLLK